MAENKPGPKLSLEEALFVKSGDWLVYLGNKPTKRKGAFYQVTKVELQITADSLEKVGKLDIRPTSVGFGKHYGELRIDQSNLNKTLIELVDNVVFTVKGADGAGFQINHTSFEPFTDYRLPLPSEKKVYW